MKMYPDDWRVRVTTALVIGACLTGAMMLGPVFGINWHERLWTLMLLLVVTVIVGNVLGRLVYRLLFRPSSPGWPEDKKGTPLK